MGSAKRFLILLKKNYLLRKRHYILTAFEIIIAVAVYFPYLLFSSTPQASNVKLSAIYPKSTVTDELTHEASFPSQYILFAPNDVKTKELMNKVHGKLTAFIQKEFPEQPSDVEMHGFESEKKLETYYRMRNINSSSSDDRLFAALVFRPVSDSRLQYKVRRPGDSSNKLHAQSISQSGKPSVFKKVVMFLQHFIDKVFMDDVIPAKHKVEVDKVQVFVQRFATPSYRTVHDTQLFSITVGILLSVSLLFFVPSLMVRIIQEKASKMKELLKVMGMKAWMYWLSWFINGYCLIVCILSLAVLCSSVNVQGDPPLYAKSDKSIIFLLYMMYGVSTVLFCLFFSIFFMKALLGGMFGIAVWIGTFIIPMIVMDLTDTARRFTATHKLLTCIFPNGGIYWSIRVILNHETLGDGIYWHNIDSVINSGDELTLSKVMIVMCCSWLMYIIGIWYFDACWPWQPGIPQPFYFPFKISYWRGKETIHPEDGGISDIPISDFPSSDFPSSGVKSPYFEFMNLDSSSGIEIKNLSKTYTSWNESKTAVNNISLRMSNGTITALLGHNGAGKTTTISMITGMFRPSMGTVIVNDFDVQQNLDRVRRSMGYCPQESIYINELTVREHLELAIHLKDNVCDDGWKSLIEEVIGLVKLEDKADTRADTLSGGMKRKLSLAMAMVGNPKVLVLDEPSSGLDPEARREVWDMLQSIRHDKTILLTTHYMEEADALGDNVAIMSHGKIFCSGSPLFLKKNFGTGYYLRMIKRDGCDVNAVLNFMKQYLPVHIDRDSGRELSLCIETSDTSKFPETFDQFEKEKSNLRIENFGLSLTTMEDVFLKVGQLAESSEKKDPSSDCATSVDMDISNSADIYSIRRYNRTTGLKLLGLQFFALFLKRFHYNRKQISSLILQTIIPVLLILCTVLAVKSMSGTSKFKKISLELPLYGSDHRVFYEVQGKSEYANVYEDLVKSKGSNPKLVNNVSDSLIDVGKKNLDRYMFDYVVAANFNESSSGNHEITALYNPIAIYSPEISLNLIHNSILKKFVSSSSIHVSIENIDTPIVYKKNPKNPLIPIVIYTIAPLGFAFITSFCLIFLIVERVSKSKHLQLMAGVNPTLFWMAHFAWDFLICSIISSIIVILVYAMNRSNDAGLSGSSIGALYLAAILYVASGISFSYLFSLILKKPVMAFLILSIFNTVMTIVGSLVIIFNVSTPPAKHTTTTEWFFRFLPTFSMTSIFAKIYENTQTTSSCSEYRRYCSIMHDQQIKEICCSNYGTYDPYTVDKYGCGEELLMLFVCFIIYSSLLCLLQSGILYHIAFLMNLEQHYLSVCRRLSKKYAPVTNINHYDSDVVDECNLINRVTYSPSTEELSRYTLLVHEMSKEFVRILAVDRITFGVLEKQCFGLLGVNGAGKTTTFSMLTGDLMMSNGTVYVNGQRLKVKQIDKQIGYCPQFDALLEALTGNEILNFFARLRGVPLHACDKVVSSLVHLVDLDEHCEKRVSTYSGGNKRKLSIAVAVIGLPNLLFLDEPTAGIDPVARRQIWTLLTKIKAAGISVVITSHSMEECEALCDRMTIMVNGRFQCLGSITHLKTKYCQGYTIQAKQKNYSNNPDNLNLQKEIDTMLKSSIPSAEMKSEHQGLLTYSVSDVNETWSHMFNVMETIKNKDELLEDYSITATSLEQVFLSFAKFQLT
ncbi:ABCA3 (predicted) [Pycnogonum litorale]